MLIAFPGLSVDLAELRDVPGYGQLSELSGLLLEISRKDQCLDG